MDAILGFRDRLRNRFWLLFWKKRLHYPNVQIRCRQEKIDVLFAVHGFNATPAITIESDTGDPPGRGCYHPDNDAITLFSRALWDDVLWSRGWWDMKSFNKVCAMAIYHELRHALQYRNMNNRQRASRKRYQLVTGIGYLMLMSVGLVWALTLFFLGDSLLEATGIFLLAMLLAKLFFFLSYYLHPIEIDARHFADTMILKSPDGSLLVITLD